MKKSHVSNKEAIEARKSPRLSTIKDIHKLSHEAGIEGAKSGAIIGASIAVVANIVDIINRKKDLGDAVEDIAVKPHTSHYAEDPAICKMPRNH